LQVRVLPGPPRFALRGWAAAAREDDVTAHEHDTSLEMPLDLNSGLLVGSTGSARAICSAATSLFLIVMTLMWIEGAESSNEAADPGSWVIDA
jgi:hypothetical protein